MADIRQSFNRKALYDEQTHEFNGTILDLAGGIPENGDDNPFCFYWTVGRLCYIRGQYSWSGAGTSVNGSGVRVTLPLPVASGIAASYPLHVFNSTGNINPATNAVDIIALADGTQTAPIFFNRDEAAGAACVVYNVDATTPSNDINFFNVGTILVTGVYPIDNDAGL